MNLKQTTLALAVAGAMASQFAIADTKISGKIDVLLEDTDVGGLDVRADDVEIDITVTEQVGAVKWIGDMDLDFAQGSGSTTTVTVNDDGSETTSLADNNIDTGDDVDTFDLDAARIVAIGSFGAFVLGHSPSGIFADIYSAADIMAENSDVFSRQGSQFNNAIAWKTPNFGPVYAVISALVQQGDDTGTNIGEEDLDLITARVTYKAHGLQASAVYIGFENTDAPTDARTAFGASYSNDLFAVAGWFETEEYTADGADDRDAFGVSASANVGDFKLKVVHEAVEIGDAEDDVTAVGFNYSVAKNITLYAETATYDQDDQDNTVVGGVVKF